MSAWERQKIASLADVPRHEYTIGPGYYDIPGDVVLQGLHQDDLRRTNTEAGYDDRRATLPRDPQNLYRPHNCPSQNEYITWSEREVAIGMAPIFVQTMKRNAGRLAPLLYGERQPIGHDMPSGARFIELGPEGIQRNANIPGQGIIENNLEKPLPRQGFIFPYTLPVNFSIPRK